MTSPDAPIEIVSYDPVWLTRFEEEAALLHRQLASWLVGPIEHIGSSAVPGLAAKPAWRVCRHSRPHAAPLQPQPNLGIATGRIRRTLSTGSANHRLPFARTTFTWSPWAGRNGFGQSLFETTY